MWEYGSSISIEDLPIGLSQEERGHRFLESHLWANCTFVVGQEKKEIRAWKELLAFASSKFATMFFGEKPDVFPDHVQLPNMKPDIFKKMLQFIYIHKIEFSSTDEAFEMCLAAHEYDLLDLVEICTVFLKKSLVSSDTKFVCDVFNCAVARNLKKLKIGALEEVQKRIRTLLLGSEEFLNLSPEALVAILESGELNIKSELDLIDAAVQWATVRCERDGRNLRDTLIDGGILKHLRFLTLTGKEFREGPVKHGLLSSDEEAALLKHISGDVHEPLPASLCPNPNRRVSNVFNYLMQLGQHRETFTVASGDVRSERFTSKIDLLLQGIVISTQVDGSHRNMFCSHYEEEINVKVYRTPESRRVASFNLGATSVARLRGLANNAQHGSAQSGCATQSLFCKSSNMFGDGTFPQTFGCSKGFIFTADPSPSASIFGIGRPPSSATGLFPARAPLSAPLGGDASSDSPEPAELYAVGWFKGRVSYDSDLHIPLVLENGNSDKLELEEDFRVDVQFNKSGTYPLVVLKKECDIRPREAKGFIVGIKIPKIKLAHKG